MKNERIREIVVMAMLTSIVVVLQLFAVAIRFGTFSISLTLIPIVIGAGLYGPWAGCWLGFVFGFTVLLSGDAASFLAVNIIGTILTVIIKGSAAGFCSGLVYKILEGRNKTVQTLLSAIICPFVNTGIFIIGCFLFFMPTLSLWAAGAGFENGYAYLIFGIVGVNFLLEVLINVVFSPVILRLLGYVKKRGLFN